MAIATNSLPTHFAAVRLMCDCFGVKMPELKQMLQAVRDREAKADKELRLRLIKEGAIHKRPFPRKLNRVMLGKAEKISHLQEEGLCTVAYQALYERIRFDGKSPLFGAAAELAEQLAIYLPRLYSEIALLLRTGETSQQEAMLILVQDVFLPTFYLELKTMSNRGIGSELSVSDCWYLPITRRGDRQYPFARVVKAWLNAAGLRYADDVGKILQSPTKRKVISNWLKGKNVPDAKAINKYVNGFKDETKRFDEPSVWKGRLALAAAMHRFCKSMDAYFATVKPDASFKLLTGLQDIESDHMPIDSDGILASRKTFFAARLFWIRMKQTEEWRAKIAKLAKSRPVEIPKSAERTEIDLIIGKHLRSMSPGNVFMECIQVEITKLVETHNEIMLRAESIQEQIFALGIIEINREFNKKGRQK